MLPDPNAALVVILQAPVSPLLGVGCTGGTGEVLPPDPFGLLLLLTSQLPLGVHSFCPQQRAQRSVFLDRGRPRFLLPA